MTRWSLQIHSEEDRSSRLQESHLVSALVAVSSNILSAQAFSVTISPPLVTTPVNKYPIVVDATILPYGINPTILLYYCLISISYL